MNNQSWVISTSDLLEGTTLSFDLLDANGNVLHKAGVPIGQRLKDRLAADGIMSVTIQGTSEVAPENVASVLMDSFDPALIEALNQSISAASAAVSNAMQSLTAGESIDPEPLLEGVQSFMNSATKDIAAALSVLSVYQTNETALQQEKIAERSAKLSLLGVITAIAQGQNDSFVSEIGLAGLLHDCSLILQPSLINRDPNTPLSATELNFYRNHPLKSAELLLKTGSIPPTVREVIEQVHEQANGTGFPRGLQIKDCNYQATILNVADAYLTLTDSSAHHQFVQSDALLYLVSQATKGMFCARTIQSMMRAMSVYPVGTVIVMDDSSKAVVVRSNTDSPMKPVVRTLNTARQKIDLTKSTRSIVGPYTDATTGRQRMPRSEMARVFWRLDAIEGAVG
jgi:HD-GYP domain-containing protein (c-di-GMP phosphodiesterase class II)